MELNRELAYRFPLVRGDDVRAVQLALHSVKIDPPCGDADGIYGDATRAAVMKFQQGFNIGRGAAPALEVTGTVRQPTWAALMSLATQSGSTATPIKAASAALAPAARPAAAPPLKPPAAGQSSVLRPLVGRLAARVPNDARAQTLLVRDWLMKTFAAEMTQAAQGTPFDTNLLCAIAAKETGVKWLRWVDGLDQQTLLARCVFDPSGDMPGTPRDAFPVNAAAFREKFGDPITRALIDEANQSRVLEGWGPQQWLYKGYGIFQYDLQHFPDHPDWFRNRDWRSIGGCLVRLIEELTEKHQAAHGDLHDTVRRYNGGGDRAAAYAVDVMQRYDWLRR